MIRLFTPCWQLVSKLTLCCSVSQKVSSFEILLSQKLNWLTYLLCFLEDSTRYIVGAYAMSLRCRDSVALWLGLSRTVLNCFQKSVDEVIAVIAVVAFVNVIISVNGFALFFLLNSELFLSHLWRVAVVAELIRLRRLLLWLLDFLDLRQWLFLTFSKSCCSICYIYSNELVLNPTTLFSCIIFRNSLILYHVPSFTLVIFDDQSSLFLFILSCKMKKRGQGDYKFWSLLHQVTYLHGLARKIIN